MTIKNILELTITNEEGRIDKVLSIKYPQYTRSQFQNFIKKGLVKCNNKNIKANYKVSCGDYISVNILEPQSLKAKPQNIPIDIVYEDNDVIVVNKPQGMVVHPSVGHENGTLVNALLYHTHLSSINGVIRPGIVHRIDKDTSGLLMVAKTDIAQIKLSEQLKDQKNLREYYAIVHGNIPEAFGVINAPIGRSPFNRKKQAVVKNGKNAITHFEVLERFDKYTFIKCILETGRTHQIRVHMSYINHPVAGDPLYGPKKTLVGKGQFLHAGKLGFIHPITGKLMVFTAELPQIFKETLNSLKRKK